MDLTIVCPSFNRASFLQETVRSVFLDGGLNCGLIVVDDASTDNTIQVLESLVAEYGPDRFRYFRQNENKGAPAARNRGLHEAKGNYVMFMDSDDIVVPSGIAELLDALETGNFDFAYGRVVSTDGDLNPLSGIPDIGEPYELNGDGIVSLSWHTMGAIYKKDFLTQRVGEWNIELTGSQDWEYQARVKLAAGRGKFVDTLVGYWRRHGGPRIGATGYKNFYVESVLKACLAIENVAISAGKLDSRLRRRLSRRLINHMFEAQGHGDFPLAHRIGREVRRLSHWLDLEFYISLSASVVPSKTIALKLLGVIRSR